jgi:hypothetical protein
MSPPELPNQAQPRRLQRQIRTQCEASYLAPRSLAEVYTRLVPLRRRALGELPRLPATAPEGSHNERRQQNQRRDGQSCR